MSCVQCGSTTNLQSHHTSYEPEETIILCKGCHQKLHPYQGVGVSPDEERIELTKNGLKVKTRIFKYNSIHLPRILRTLLKVKPRDVLEWFLDDGKILVKKKGR